MNDNKTECQCPGCQHNQMYCSYHHRHFVLRWLLGLLILVLVFWMGYKLGELRGAFGGSEFGSFGHGYNRMYMFKGVPGGQMMPPGGMMQYWTTTSTPPAK